MLVGGGYAPDGVATAQLLLEAAEHSTALTACGHFLEALVACQGVVHVVLGHTIVGALLKHFMLQDKSNQDNAVWEFKNTPNITRNSIFEVLQKTIKTQICHLILLKTF